MKRSLVLFSSALLLSACANYSCRKVDPKAEAAKAAAAKALAAKAAAPTPAAPKPAATPASDGTARVTMNGVEIEKVEFRVGVSSATVEQLARQQACVGGVGAGLLTAPGPVEVYRMACDNGKIFMARCELRQCKPM